MKNSKAVEHIELLGLTVVDRVTGFKGTVTSISFELYGCVQAIVQARLQKGEKEAQQRWLDINRLEFKKDKRVMPVPNFDEGYQAEGKQGADIDKPFPGE